MKLGVNLLCCFFLSFAAMGQNQYFVLFEYDKAEVPDTAMAFLIKTIYSNEVGKIYLEGHCDSIGSRQYNYTLSQRRVKAVENLLVDNGFDRSKIEGKVGFGKDKPITPNSSDEARQKNRRVLVQFEIIKKLPKKEVLKKKTNEPTNQLIVQPAFEEKKELGIPIGKNSFTIKKNNTIEAAPKPKELKSENFIKNSIIALPNLLFQGGRHFLINRSNASLDTLIRILKNKPTLKVEIQGHVCCTTYQKDGYDWDTRTDDLSVNRAKAIKAFLVKNGISSERLKTNGFGGSRKLYPEEIDDFQRQQNRRVEVKVLSE